MDCSLARTAMSPEITFTLNGAPVQVTPAEGEALLHTLRSRLGITSIKDGCHPQGQCGACLAIVNGHPRMTCTLTTDHMQGAQVVTLEGLSAESRELLVKAFEGAAAGQCGYCLPGIALHAHSLVEQHPEPKRDEIHRALDIHLCRCGGYSRLVEAVSLLAKARRGERIEEPPRDGGVGASIPRRDLGPMVLGERPFAGDLSRPGMLHGGLVLSPYARAKVVAIDATRALAMPGVVRVVTAADVPGERWFGLLIADVPGFVAVGEEARCVGDVIAAVAAVDELTARAATNLIDVTYEVLAPVTDPKAALAPDAPRVNPRHVNQLSRSVIRRGDVDAALAASAHVARGTWKTQRIEHLFLEPESALAVPEGDKLSLWTQGQGIFDDRATVAKFLGIPEASVHVTLVPPGGAFGGKEDVTVQPHAALLAWLTGKPVRLALDREQSIRMHPKRHPITLEYEVGCDAEGHLTAVRARLLGDSGAYASVGAKVLERAAGHACGPYKVPAVDIEAVAAYTNNPPCGAMRGFGVVQVAFALEACLDMLAADANLDPWEIRWRNAVDIGDVLTTGQRIEKSVGIRATLEAVRPAYNAARAEGYVVGIACGIKNSGIGNGVIEWGRARLVVEADRTVSVYNGYTEMGQGLSTVLVQIAREATGLPAETFTARTDTRYALACGQTTGSRATLHGGRAVLSAAQKLRADLDAGETLETLIGREYAADEAIRDTVALEDPRPNPKTHTSYGYATQVCVLDAKGRVARIIAAHDVGRVINPAMCVAQIEGSVTMGLGYALTEELACVEGMPETFWLRDLGALRAKDVPPIEVKFVEAHEPEGPYGAKGVGEIGLVPTAAAVANALARFEGKRRYVLPMKDSPASRAISVGHHVHHRVPGHDHDRDHPNAPHR